MPFRRICRLMVGLAAGSMAIFDVQAQGYLGFGVSNLSLTSQYSAIGTRSATGFTLFGGADFLPTWFWELSVSANEFDVGQTENIYYPPDRAEYSILRFSIAKQFWRIAERGWTPWAAVGSSYHYIGWKTYFYEVSGSGLSLGAGADFEPARPWRIRLQAFRHRFSAHDNYGYGPYSSRTSELSAAVMFTFR